MPTQQTHNIVCHRYWTALTCDDAWSPATERVAASHRPCQQRWTWTPHAHEYCIRSRGQCHGDAIPRSEYTLWCVCARNQTCAHCEVQRSWLGAAVISEFTSTHALLCQRHHRCRTLNSNSRPRRPPQHVRRRVRARL